MDHQVKFLDLCKIQPPLIVYVYLEIAIYAFHTVYYVVIRCALRTGKFYKCLDMFNFIFMTILILGNMIFGAAIFWNPTMTAATNNSVTFIYTAF